MIAGISFQTIDPTTYEAFVQDFAYVGDNLEIQVLITNNIGKDVQRFVVSASDENWKVNLESQVRTFLLKQDERDQVKIDISKGLKLDLSEPAPENPPDDTADDVAIKKFNDQCRLDKIARNFSLLSSEALDIFSKASEAAQDRMKQFLAFP